MGGIVLSCQPAFGCRAFLFCAFSCLPDIPDGHPKIFIQSSAHVEVLYYSPAHEYLVTHLIRSYENALNFERNLFHFTPSQKLTILLEDFGDYGHGAAGTVPSNFIDVGLAPFSYTYETLPANERMTWIMNHESIHIVMGDNSNSLDRRFRSLFFGKVCRRLMKIQYPFSTSTAEPVRGTITDAAGFTKVSPRLSWKRGWRADSVELWAVGMKWSSGPWSATTPTSTPMLWGWNPEGTAADFQTGANDSYLYGTRLHDMALLTPMVRRSPLLAWITRGENTQRYFGSRFAEVCGMGMDTAWKMWIAEQNGSFRRL